MSINILQIKKDRKKIIEAKKEIHIINFTANSKKTVDMIKKIREAKSIVAKMQTKISQELKKVAK